MKYLWLILTVVVLCIVPQSHGEECKFPGFVLNDEANEDDYWLYGTTLDGKGKRHVYTESQFTVNDNQWGNVGDVAVLGNCIKAEADNKLLVTSIYHGAKNTTEYSCLQFTKKTDNVVTFGKGLAIMNETTNCSNVDYKVDDWPLIANVPRGDEEWKPCPLMGGYMFTGTSGGIADDNRQPLCNHPIPSQLHAECMMGEGLIFQFPSEICIPANTGWSLEHTMYCLGDTWTEGNFTFVLLGEEYYKPRMIMRLPGDYATATEMTIDIFQDMVSPSGSVPNDTTLYMSLNIKQLNDVIANGCTDDLTGCEEGFCSDPMYSNVCKKKCAVCGGTGTQDTCTFSNQVVSYGTWLNDNDEKKGIFSIDPNSFSVQDFSNFTCNKELEGKKDSYVVQSQGTNGCGVRYMCTKFSRASQPVLQYKIGQSSFSIDEGLCTERKFLDDPLPIGDKYRSRFMKNLISTDPTLINETIPCGFRGNFSVSAVKDLDCNGHMWDIDEDCKTTDTIDLDVQCKGPGKNVTRDFTCLASWTIGSHGQRIIITRINETWDSCWIVADARNPMRIEVMTSPQCNEATLESIDAGRRTPYTEFSSTRIDTCDGKPVTVPTTTGAPVTSTPGTTSNNTDTSPTTTGPNEPDNTTAHPPTNNAGLIVGICVGVLLVVAAVGVAIYYYMKKRKGLRAPYRVL